MNKLDYITEAEARAGDRQAAIDAINDAWLALDNRAGESAYSILWGQVRDLIRACLDAGKLHGVGADEYLQGGKR